MHNWVVVKIKRCRNFVYQTACHLVWRPKYRKRVLIGTVLEKLPGSCRMTRHERAFVFPEYECSLHDRYLPRLIAGNARLANVMERSV